MWAVFFILLAGIFSPTLAIPGVAMLLMGGGAMNGPSPGVGMLVFITGLAFIGMSL